MTLKPHHIYYHSLIKNLKSQKTHAEDISKDDIPKLLAYINWSLPEERRIAYSLFKYLHKNGNLTLVIH